MHSLVIADDETNQREGLCQFIDWNALGFSLTASFSDGAELIEHIASHPADVILTDIRMLDISGLDVAEYVHLNCPDTAVVFISGYKEFDYAQKAMEMDVKRYMVKPVSIEEIKRVFTELNQELKEKKALKEFIAESRKFANSHNMQEKEPTDLENAIINKAKAYINSNYMNDIMLNNIADHVYLNPVYFSRFFKQKTGKNYVDYLLELRINKAVELLKTGKWKVYEIGDKVGYRNTKYFTRVFKNFTGYSPKDYLRKIITEDGSTS